MEISGDNNYRQSGHEGLHTLSCSCQGRPSFGTDPQLNFIYIRGCARPPFQTSFRMTAVLSIPRRYLHRERVWPNKFHVALWSDHCHAAA